MTIHNPFKRREKVTPTIIIQHKGLEVKHVIEKKADPMPIFMTMIVRDNEGREYVCPPININGRMGFGSSVPLSYITGNTNDNGRQFRIDFRFGY